MVSTSHRWADRLHYTALQLDKYNLSELHRLGKESASGYGSV